MKLRYLLLALFVVSPLLAQDAAFRARVGAQIAALQAEKAARTPAQEKISTALLRAGRVARGEAQAPGPLRLRTPRLKADPRGRQHVDIKAEVSGELLGEITRLGGVVESSFARDRAIRAWLPFSALEPLAARADVQSIQPAAEAMTNAGSVTSAGDIAHRANTVRSTFGVDGSGVRVGVLSDSADFLSNAQSLGDLPNDVVVLDDIRQGSGEGTAMMEIVHDLAPGAKLFFATAFKGAASFANNIRALAKAGCSVIIDDVTYFNESPFQDDTIAKAVNDVSAQGVLFFSSARNSGNKNDGTSGTWEGDFTDGGDASAGGFGSQARFHNFGGSITNIVTNNNSGRLDLFWADPLDKSGNDYDLFIVDANGNVLDFSNDTQNGNDDPYEAIGQTFVGDRVLIVKFKGDPRFLHLDSGRGRFSISTGGNVRGHNASGAPNAFSVAAVSAFQRNTPFNPSDVVETFSSDGPRRIFFDPKGKPLTPGNFSSTGGVVLQKPDIAAADGVATTLPGNSGLNPFFGTSAAAPHAGAIAALLRSADPLRSPAEIRAVLQSTALDIEAAGVDRDSGFGLLNALAAFQAFGVAPRPNLAPAPFGGRPSPIIVSNTTGTTTDSPVLLSTDTLRVDIGVANTSAVNQTGTNVGEILLDGANFANLAVSNLAANTAAGVPDINFGSLAPGLHTITVRLDINKTLAETNEGDNEYTKTFVVLDATAPAPTLAKAAYAGVVQPAPNTTPEIGRYGSFSINLAASGAFTASLELGNDKFSLKGMVAPNGDASFGPNASANAVLKRRSGDNLAFDFSLAALGASDEILGALLLNSAPYAQLFAKRGVKPAPPGVAGSYTAIVAAAAPGTPAAGFPQGFGAGLVKVSKNGKARFAGKLPDGYGFSLGAGLTDDGTLAFHELTKKASGVVNGLIQFRNLSNTSDFDSTLQWVRLPTGKAPAYPAGWPMGINASLFGSRYTRAAGDAAVPFLGAPDADGNAVLSLAGTSGLSTPTGARLNIDAKGKDKSYYAAAAKLKFALKSKTGGFGGSFKSPVTGKTVKFSGVVLDKQQLGAGFFIDGEESGTALLNAD